MYGGVIVDTAPTEGLLQEMSDRLAKVGTRIAAASPSVRALLFRENRPNPPRDQVDRANANVAALATAIKGHEVVPVEIFGADGAVVGGRNVIAILSRQQFDV
jgi:hypothetical protein